ncbi:GAF domain-containing sensor histidine kinase [Geodermatophilus ruber]|uniref:GAF domain-containing sensor histidine kinase n=1 Tax=Geodermatophilus ruber TaxID=504800 RepID=UPI001FE08C58|nr:GAF domain-containing sensor histidine kinase [Geodermatophilus ruber]
MPPPDPGVRNSTPAAIPVLAAGVQAAARSAHVERTLREIVTIAVDRADATYGALGVLRSDGRSFDRFVVVGMGVEDQQRIGRFPTGNGVLGLLIQKPVPLRLDDLTAHPAAVGLPPGHPPMHTFLGVPVRVRGRVFGHLYLTEKRTGEPFSAADEEVISGLCDAAGLAIEGARRVERAEHRRAWAQAGSDIATALLSGADPDSVLRSIAQRVAFLASADVAGVLVPTPGDADSLTVVAAVGLDEEIVHGLRVPLIDSQLGVAHRSGVPRLLVDATSQAPGGKRAPVLGELVAGYGPALFIPLGGGPALGTVVAMRLRGRPPFEPDTLELAAAFAGQAAVALELARTQQRERRLQVEADRDRIARDLHDHVVQRIFATGLALDRISRSLEETQPEVAARLAERVDELDDTIARIRSAIFELHQAEDGSPTAVRRRISDVVRSITDGHGLLPDVRLRSSVDDLPPTLVTDVVAVVCELVTNVVKHASATRVTVNVSVDGEVSVVVTDDGIGLPAITVRSGLANLADRAERFGGRLTASTGPSGTEIRWVVPLPRQ